ncbi:MAG: diguanylate cyclase [Lachnospiraceae bacterium]|nr:diguanylate cyclase [Lachnospiraceae bacterium]
MCILIYENARIPDADKKLFYLTYILIAASSFAEWLGMQVNGREDVQSAILLGIKTADYILTPMAGGALVVQMHMNNIYEKILMWILAANTLFQITASFFGWMLVIDDKNYYHHGPLYGLYIIVYLMIIALIVAQFLLYGKAFRRKNSISLYAIMCLVVVGILFQEAFPGGYRTAYLGMTIGAALMFIHYTEFSQLAMEDQLLEKQSRIDTDALTGVFSRMAYSDALESLDSEGRPLPEGFAAFTIDINGLKNVNDRLGHDAGDELICGAARCIEKIFDSGRCYRTGGDEFVVLAYEMDSAKAELAFLHLNKEAYAWHGEKVGNLELSTGYALSADNPEMSAEELVRKADLAMYEAKAAYYQRMGKNRRRK